MKQLWLDSQVLRGVRWFLALIAYVIVISVSIHRLWDKDYNCNVVMNFYGRVVDSSGKPVSNVYVTGYIIRGATIEPMLGWHRSNPPGTVSDMYHGITNQNGDFEVANERGQALNLYSFSFYDGHQPFPTGVSGGYYDYRNPKSKIALPEKPNKRLTFVAYLNSPF